MTATLALPATASADGGTLRCVLVDADSGAPVGGERIELRRVDPAESRRFPYPWVPASAGGTSVAEQLSDDHGEVRFDGLAPGLYRLETALPRVGGGETFPIDAGVELPVQQVTVALGRWIAGRVVGPGGAPVAGARVWLEATDAAVDLSWRERRRVRRDSDADGRFRLATLPDGRLWIAARSEELGYSEVAVIGRSVAGAIDVELTLRGDVEGLWPQDRRPYGVIGVQLSSGESGPVIDGLVDGGPAASGGLRVGDTIAAIEGRATERMAWREVLLRCRGEVGAPVSLTVDRGGERFDVTLTRVRSP